MAKLPDYGPPPWNVIHPDLISEDMARQFAEDRSWVKPATFERVAFVQATRGWAKDSEGGPMPKDSFHAGYQKQPDARQKTRALGYEIISDTITALDRTCYVGSVTFHIHGERPPTGPVTLQTVDRNVHMLVSDNIRHEPRCRDAIHQLRKAFQEDVAYPFVQEWQTRALRSGTIGLASPPRVTPASPPPFTRPVQRASTPATPPPVSRPVQHTSTPIRGTTPHVNTMFSPSSISQNPRPPQPSPASPRTPRRHAAQGDGTHRSIERTLEWAREVSNSGHSSIQTPSSASSVSTSTTARPLTIPLKALELLCDLKLNSLDHLEQIRDIMATPSERWAEYITGVFGLNSTSADIIAHLLASGQS
ncbi:hypothetical protein BD410DRAFT_844536 [Rickenella mellea]|uniref:Uncharacterized protein n=1 Tax=Rickenella mellea TaxID=50990 RepID=A0A4Y7PLZ7_9AGAM|nr:hypothetical protein BD410DRAFT_844536 [Rickenella mellea]